MTTGSAELHRAALEKVRARQVEKAVSEKTAARDAAQPQRDGMFETQEMPALNATRSSGPSGRKGLPRHTARQTAQLKLAFLDRYQRYGNIGHCADMVGINRNTFYSWQETDEQFALAFQQAEKRALETLEHEAWRRAVEGSPYTRTSYYRGEPVGTDHKIEYSDQLLTLLLRAKAPERYREKMDLAVSQVIKTVAGVEPASVL